MNRYFLWILASIGIGNLSVSAQTEKHHKADLISPQWVRFSGPSTSVKDVLLDIRRSTNIIVEVPADTLEMKMPTAKAIWFWETIETLAKTTECKIAVSGSKIVLTKAAANASKPIAFTDGAFRIVAKQIITKRDLESGHSVCEIAYEIQWLPTIPIYLIDSDMTVTAAKFGEKSATPGKAAVRVAPNGSTYSGTIRLADIPRSATQLDVVTGEFKVIGAARMMRVEFKDLTIVKNATQITEGVSVTMRPLKKVGDMVEMTFDMEYPPSHPLFETFQTWAASNKLKLIGPDERNAFTPADYNLPVENGRNVSAKYLFSAGKGQVMPNLKGWKAQYETPVPMIEQTVKFEWKNIPLP